MGVEGCLSFYDRFYSSPYSFFVLRTWNILTFFWNRSKIRIVQKLGSRMKQHIAVFCVCSQAVREHRGRERLRIEGEKGGKRLWLKDKHSFKRFRGIDAVLLYIELLLSILPKQILAYAYSFTSLSLSFFRA